MENDPDNVTTMASVVSAKATIIVGMFFTTLFFGLVPTKLISYFRRSPNLQRYISFASCASGGVFLAACIMDLFPDVRLAIDHVLDEIEKKYHKTVDYPVSEFIMLVGFFLIIIVEGIVAEWQDSMKREYAALPGSVSTAVVSVSAADESSPLLQGDAPAPYQNDDPNPNINVDQNDIENNENTDDGHHGHDHLPLEVFVHSTFRATLLLLALSFHSLFEGLAIGLQTAIGELFSVFIAVIMHKAILAFSLGMTVAQTNLRKRFMYLSIFIFSISSPIGVAIGIGMLDIEQSIGRDIANGVLQVINYACFGQVLFESNFCLWPVSEADAEGLGTTISPPPHFLTIFIREKGGSKKGFSASCCCSCCCCCCCCWYTSQKTLLGG
jgi:zinc transporter 1/2/3